jgi:PTS system ascorbate-specific IIA component
MSVGVLLVTHPGIGSAMLNTATRIIGGSSLPIKCLEVPPDAALEPLAERARGMLEDLDRGAGVLVLTDIYGATPHNVAQQVACGFANGAVLAGLNLPMLVRVFNYAEDDLDTLLGKAAEGGTRGILSCPSGPAGAVAEGR